MDLCKSTIATLGKDLVRPRLLRNCCAHSDAPREFTIEEAPLQASLTHRPSQLVAPLVAVLLQGDLLPDGGPLLNQRMAEAPSVLAQ